MIVRRLRDRVLVIACLYLVAAGCGGNGCSCMQPLPNGFPANERHPNALQARLSSTGVQFMEDNASALVNALIPGGLNFDVPPSCGGNPEVCCTAPPGTCGLIIDIDPRPGDPPRLELTPRASPDNQLGVLLRARIRTTNPMPITYDTGIFGDVMCDVEINTEWAGVPSVTVTTDIDFNQDPTVGTTRIAAVNTNLADLDTGDISLSGGFTCAIADAFKGVFIDQLISGFTDQIGGAIEDQVCKKCTDTANCAPFATCNGDGVCELNDAGGQRCLQEVGMTGRLLAASLLSGLSPGQSGAMDLYDVAGGYAKTNDDGLSLGILGGGIPADGLHNACVPPAAPPALVAIPEAPIFKANSGPTGAFDIGIGLHEYYLNQNAWAAYESGFLCANVGTRSVALLNSGTFSILVPSLVDLLHGETAPLVLALRPQEKPVLTLGLGTFTTNSSGEQVIDDPLITIVMNTLQIDFYALVDERYVRLFTLQTDLTLPIGLDVDDMGQLVPVLGDLENAFQNLSVTNSALVAETPTEIADKFPAVLSIALPFVADALGAIAVPSIAGLDIKIPPGGITSVENKTFLAIFGNLAVSAGKPMPRVQTTAEVVAVTVPPTAAFHAPRLDRNLRPVVELALGGIATDGTERGLEWQYKIDQGLWSPYTSSPRVQLARDTFWLQGRHRIEVRARERGKPDTTDSEPIVLEPVIDTIAPAIQLVDTGDGVQVGGTDLVSGPGAMNVAWRTSANGAWIPAGVAPAVLPVVTADLPTLEVTVTDEAGNVGVASGASLDFHGRVPSSGGCGCEVSRASSAGGAAAGGVLLALGLLGLVGLAPAWKRRRRLLPFAVAALAVVAGACGGSSGTGDDDDTIPDVEAGPTGRYNDIAASGNRVVISAYEEDFGDLVVGELQSDNTVRFVAVDGVPDVAPLLDPNGYRAGVNEPGENVGAYTSLAVAGDQARVAYQHIDDGTLKYAAEDGDGGWKSHVVDSGMGGRAGYYTSISVDSSNVPGIAYMAWNVDDGASGKKAQLRWAQAASDNPQSEIDWTVSILAEAPIPCAGLCGDPDAFACIAVGEPNENTCAAIVTTCAPECSGDNACVGGACVPIQPAPESADIVDGTGLYTSAGRLSDGRPVISFYDRVLGDLNLAVRDQSGSWTTVQLDFTDGMTDRGQWSSLAVAADDTVHVAYQDALADSLLHVSWAGGAVGPVEVIDDGIRPERPHPVGASASLVIDGSGALSVAYQDAASSDLLYARANGDGTWTHGDLMTGDNGFGYWISAAAQGNTVYVANYVYDRSVFPLGELQVTTLP